MGNRAAIHVEGIRLVIGNVLLRLTDSPSGLKLETRLDPEQPVVPQKERLFTLFEAALARAEFVEA